MLFIRLDLRKELAYVTRFKYIPFIKLSFEFAMHTLICSYHMDDFYFFVGLDLYVSLMRKKLAYLIYITYDRL